MKIVQITDLHIDKEEEYPFDIDVRENLLRVLHEITLTNPDHLVISGDLCYSAGDANIYQWIKNEVEEYQFDYSVISGNHDDSVLMAKVFEMNQFLTGHELFYAKKIGKRTFLFLDSSLGFHSKIQLNWLKRQIKNANEDLFIFMHHPPAIVGVPFMDNKYALQDIEQIQKILFSYPKNISIFCGHYHIEKTVRLKNVLIQITPSLFFQIDQYNPEFKVDHHDIAYRNIEINNGQFTSTVRYLRGSKK